MKISKTIVLGVAAALMFVSQAFAKDISFELSVDRTTIAVGEGAELDITFNDTANIPALDLPHIDGLEFRYVGPSTRMSIINGQSSSSVSHVYTVAPLKTGTFTLGPLRFSHNGDSYVSNQIRLEVTNSAGAGGAPAQAGANPSPEAALKDRAFLVIQAKKNKVYLNEVVPLSVKLFINNLPLRDVQYPQLKHDGISVEQWSPHRQYQEQVGGVTYQVIEFPTTFFAVRPGEFKIGPAELECNLMVKQQGRRKSPGFMDFLDSDMLDDFFGSYQTVPIKIESAQLSFTALEVPQEGRPQGFTGAVGNFAMEASAAPNDVKAGDPITLKIAITGEGNFNTAGMPRLSSENNFKIYEPHVKQTQGRKEFEQVIMPLSEEIKEIPALTFSFFNTQTGTYETLTQGPFPVTVRKPDKEEELKIVEGAAVKRVPVQPRAEDLGRDIVFIKSDPGRLLRRGSFLYRNKGYLLGHLFFPLGFIGLFIVNKRRLKLQTDIRYARHLHAPRKARLGLRAAEKLYTAGDTQAFYDCLYRVLREYLGDHFHFPSGGITVSSIDELLKGRRISDDVRGRLRELFIECDTARYAAGEFQAQNMEASLKKLEEVIDYFQRNRV